MASAWKAERVRSATTTIFAEMSALATSTGSVNLGQGFPDTDGPRFMLDEARDAIAAGGHPDPPRRHCGGRQPVPAGPRHHGPPGGGRGTQPAALRPRVRPGHRGPGHHGGDG